jgi:hypothetical protein
MSPTGTRSELHNKGRIDMASSGKKKTTMAKLTRESKLRERRLDKQARKEARKNAPPPEAEQPDGTLYTTSAEPHEAASEPPALEPAGQALTDA